MIDWVGRLIHLNTCECAARPNQSIEEVNLSFERCQRETHVSLSSNTEHVRYKITPISYWATMQKLGKHSAAAANTAGRIQQQHTLQEGYIAWLQEYAAAATQLTKSISA